MKHFLFRRAYNEYSLVSEDHLPYVQPYDRQNMREFPAELLQVRTELEETYRKAERALSDARNKLFDFDHATYIQSNTNDWFVGAKVKRSEAYLKLIHGVQSKISTQEGRIIDIRGEHIDVHWDGERGNGMGYKKENLTRIP